MASVNKVILIGNLTRDPELRYTPKGSAVTELGLAVNRKFRVENDLREEVTYVDITFWGAQAETIHKYVQKGSPIYIEGRLQLDQWEDRETGQRRSKLKVVGESLQLLGSRQDGGGGGGFSQSPPPQAAAPPPSDGRSPDQAFYDAPPAPSDDDVPF